MIKFIESVAKGGKTTKALEQWLTGDNGLFLSNLDVRAMGMTSSLAERLKMSEFDVEKLRVTKEMAYVSNFEHIFTMIDLVLTKYKFDKLYIDLDGFRWVDEVDILKLEEFCKTRGINTLVATKQLPFNQSNLNLKKELDDIMSRLRNLITACDGDEGEEFILRLKACWADLEWASRSLNIKK